MASDGEYNVSDSEDEYDENEKQLLNKVRNRKQQDSDSETEVLGVGASSDSDDDKNDLAASDIDDEDDDLPNQRAWGKDKRQFYKTDYVDADYGGFQGKDAHLAEQEEEEARTLQKQLAQQLDDDDFVLDLLAKKSEETEKPSEEIIKTDISKLSSRQKLQILQKESPEFFSLVEDYREKMAIAKDYLHPVMQKYRKGQIPNCKAIDFVQTHYELILNYCTNIYMYLLLKASKVNVQNHPVIKKLYQYRQLLLQLEPVFNEVIKVQIEILLKETADEVTSEEAVKTNKKTLKLLANLKKQAEKPKKKQVKLVELQNPTKKIKLNDMKADGEEKMMINEKSSSESDEDKSEEEEVDKTELEKRAITYEMAKNKGLTPHRKKEQRNPRVKHKMKYRKAMIRRKGAVREPRKELSRYGGEISGIKATVSKSIKIKS